MGKDGEDKFVCGGVQQPYSECGGNPPDQETETCPGTTPCCQFAEEYVDCANLKTADLAICVSPWTKNTCLCPDPTTGELTPTTNEQVTNCPWDPNNPPIDYDPSVVCGTAYDETINCAEFIANGSCVTWNVVTDANGNIIGTTQEDASPADPIVDCDYRNQNCWGIFSDWSECCGSCETGAYQWRMQLLADGYSLSDCRSPPGYEVRSCDTGPCCSWIRDDNTQWSVCESPSTVCPATGVTEGSQWRFPYTCSCGEESKCPEPPAIETQTCETPCCGWGDYILPSTCGYNQLGDQCVTWATRACTCNEEQYSECTIEDCYGVPDEQLTECQCPESVTVSARNTDSTRNDQHSFSPINREAWKTQTWPDNTRSKIFM
jgi:hypothetical protein